MAHNDKINEVKCEIPNITGQATSTALNYVKNNIPDVSTLVKNADYDTKIVKIEKKLDHDHSNKYITIQEFNKLTTDSFEVSKFSN